MRNLQKLYEALHFAIHEADWIFDEKSGSPTLHEIWHKIESSGENAEAKIDAAVELVKIEET